MEPDSVYLKYTHDDLIRRLPKTMNSHNNVHTSIRTQHYNHKV